MQEKFDWLYERSKHNATQSINLLDLITSEANIMIAYRMIKTNTGAKTAGIDGQTIDSYRIQDKDKFIEHIRKAITDYTPHMVRRVLIPKANGKKRPLGIPTMRDRMIGQMIMQVLNPICEAKFYKHSYGFRNNRSTKHAIARCDKLIFRKYHHVVDIDIKGFFDNVNHSLLLSQLYTIGIKDKRVLALIGKMLKAPIDEIGIPTKGVPQGGILSPLLSNVVLNDLDWWIARQWEEFPTVRKYKNKNTRQAVLRHTNLKRMFIVRYADDFKVFTRNANDAQKVYHSVRRYLKNHLKLDISPEKSSITNLRKRSTEFLGFELKTVKKGKWHVTHIHVSTKSINRIKEEIRNHLKNIQRETTLRNVLRYNAYVLGIHQYYKIATHVFTDFKKLAYQLSKTHYNRLINRGRYEIPRSPPNQYRRLYKTTYRTYKVADTYLYPLVDITWVMARPFNPNICDYTKLGRNKHRSLESNLVEVINRMGHTTMKNENIEYYDNRISKYVMQNGKCSVTGFFLDAGIIHCHHITPKHFGGTDQFNNLVIIHKWVHKLIHATNAETIQRYKTLLSLNVKQLDKVNTYRKKCNLTDI